MRRPSLVHTLEENLAFIQQKEWNEVAKRLNHPKHRDQMLLALSSMKDINSIEEALSYQGILYALDANTSTQLALQHESIAKRVLRQSIWQRMLIGFLKLFGLKVYWDLPATRLRGHHFRQLFQKFAVSLNRFFRNISGSLSAISKDRSLLRLLDFKNDHLHPSSDPAAETRREEHCYQHFSRIIHRYDMKQKKWVVNPKKFPELQREITALWGGDQSLQKQNGAKDIVKRAMIRVIGDHRVPVIFKGAPESFYRDIFGDRGVLKNFINDTNSIRAFKSLENRELRNELRQKLRERVLHYFWSCQQQSPQLKDFTLVHVEVINELFNMEKDELYAYPDICFEVVNNVLLHHRNHRLMDSFLSKKPESEFVQKLLQHATPMQWLKFVVSNDEVQKKIRKKVNKCESKIIKCENDNAGSEKDKEKELHKLKCKKNILQNVGLFFELAVDIVMEKENRQKIISDRLLPVLYDLEGKAFDPDHADIAEALKSLKAKEPDKLLFEQLIDKSNAESLSTNFRYLLKSIRNFPKWLFNQAASDADLKLDEAQLREILHYRVFGSDVLRHLENDYDKHSTHVRTLLLETPELLARLLRIQRKKTNHKEIASRMASIIQKEINWLNQTNAKTYSPIIIHLASSECLDYIVEHADPASIVTLLEAIRPLSEQTTGLKPLEQKISRALIKAYRNSDGIRERFKDVEILNQVILSRCSDAELVEIVTIAPSCFDFIFSIPALYDRYIQSSIPGALELMMLYCAEHKNELWDESKLPFSKLLSQFYRSTPSHVLMKLLPIIITKVRDQRVQRSEVYRYLESSEFAVQARRASSSALFNLFIQAKDPRAIRLIFFKHPSLADELMRKCWLGLTATELMELFSHRIESWILPELFKPKNFDFGAEMISALVKHRLLRFAENKVLFKAIMDRVTLSQLNQLMAADPKLAEMILTYFRDQSHRQDFIAALKRRDGTKDISALRQLLSLFRNQPEILKLFCDYVHQDYRYRKSTESFDSAIIAPVQNDEDHQAVFNILKLCYGKVGGQFYQNFSVPLNSSKTRQFILYHLSGGLVISTLYNSHIRLLRDVWRKILKARNQNGAEHQDYLEQLEDPSCAGDFLSLDFGSSHAEKVLTTLYAFSRLIKEGYWDFLKESHSTAKRVKGSVLYIRLFKALIEAESKCLWLIYDHCTPLQLAQLADADRYLARNCTPIQNFIFKDFPILCLGKIQRDGEATRVLLKSNAFKQNVATSPLLNNMARNQGFFSQRQGLVRQRPQDLRCVYERNTREKGDTSFENESEKKEFLACTSK
jgi:predicted house-cleaning noncanonical NTP pyrophosphatase (MazG superfamily)